MKNRRHSQLLILWTLALLTVATAMGQSSGTIQGTVKDSSGAVVPQASVTARNIATGVETTRQTGASGLYVLTQLAQGEYSVRVTAPGFQTLTHENIVLDALSTIGLDLELKVGSATEQITITAEAPVLRTEDATLGTTMQQKLYAALPIAMGAGLPRDPSQFIALVPGVSAVSTQTNGPTYATFNGGQQETNELYVEGVAVTFPNQQGDTRNLALGISIEAVEQFQAEINGQKAQFQGQGMHNYTLKSGTNQFHGNLYEYLRNTALDARGFFATTTPVERMNEFGGSLGGPIKKDKIFFFTNYTGYYYTNSDPSFLTIPTLKQRNGDFSELPVIIYDPGTQTCVGAVCSKQPFANNFIPANRLSSVSKNFQASLPAPTNSDIVNNYLATAPDRLHNNNTTSKVDLNHSEKHRSYVVFTYGKFVNPGGAGLPLPYRSPRLLLEIPIIAQAHHTYAISPNLLNSTSYGLMRLEIPQLSLLEGALIPQKAGLTGLPTSGRAPDSLPSIAFAGPNSPGGWGSAGQTDEYENSFNFSNNLSWVHQKHVITAGFQLQRLQDNSARPAGGTGAALRFSNLDTAGYSATGSQLTATGNGYASYMLGAVNSATITENRVVVVGARYHGYALFVQDDWAVNSKLTLNVGLRWNLFGPGFEVRNRTSFMNPDIPNPAAGGRLGALQFAGNGVNSCNCTMPVKTQYKNFQPRIGLAFKLDRKTVIRTSFNMQYTNGANGIGGNGGAAGAGQLGYNVPAIINFTTTGLPAFYWDGGVPARTAQTLFDPGFGVGFTTTNPAAAESPQAIFDQELSGKPPVYINWSFGLQREITQNMTAGASYSASVGHFLPRATANGAWSNSMHPRYLALGSLLTAQATPANIAAARAIMPDVGLPFGNFQGTIAQMLKPYPQYNGVSCYSCDLGNSTFHSLQLTLNQRFAMGLTFQLGYTFSKELDNVPGGGQLGSAGGTRNPYDGKLDKGLGAIHRPHVFNGTFLYNLPFGKGHNLNGGNIVVRAIVSNWALSGIVRFASAGPLAVLGNACNVPGVIVTTVQSGSVSSGAATCIASYNPSFTGPVRINGDYGDGNALGTGGVSYLNQSAFVNPAAYNFGNLPRSAPFGLLGPKLLSEDVTLRREFPIRESLKFSLAMDVINVTNSVNFAAPNTTLGNANFGRVTAVRGTPRRVQLNARITF